MADEIIEAPSSPLEMDPVRYLAAKRQSLNSEDAQIKALESEFGLGESTPKPSPGPEQPEKNTEDSEITRLEKELGIASSPVVEKAKSIGKQAAGGALDAVQNTWNAIVDLADWGENYLAKQGIGPGDLVEHAKTDFSDRWIPPSSSFDERLIRGVVNFAVPFAGWSKAFKVGKAATTLGRLGSAAAAGAVTDFTAFDPADGRLSDLIEQNPSLRNPVTSYLASKPGDSGAEGRFKNVIEGMGLGALTEGLFQSVRALKGAKEARSMHANPEIPTKGADLPLSAETQAAQAQVAQSTKIYSPEEAGALSPHKYEQEYTVHYQWENGINKTTVVSAKSASDAIKDVQGIIGPTKINGVSGPGKMTKESTGAAVSDAIAGVRRSEIRLVPGEGTVLDLVRSTEPQAQAVTTGMGPPPMKAGNLRVDKYDISEQAKAVIAQTDQIFSGEIKAARGAPISSADLRELADESGLSVRELLSVPEYQTLGKEGILKLRETVANSAQIVFDAAERARTGSHSDKAALLQVLDIHRALQARLSGATAEWGRSGLAFKMNVGPVDAQTKAKLLKQMIDLAGGEATVADIADRLATLKTPKQLAQVIERTKLQKLRDATFEVYVNSLLSGPRTHINNFLSNTSSTVSRLVETAIGSTSSALRGAQKEERIYFGEVGAQIAGMMNATSDAFSLAWKALKTGKPTMDRLQKFELSYGKSIADLAEGGDSALAQALGPIGSFVSLPSRALMASDEFFKAIHQRASIYQQAIRESEKAGLSGKAFKDSVNSLIENPTQAMIIQANQDMRTFTYTKALEGGFQAVDQAVKRIPGLRVVMPFTRTNLNILEYQIERSPFAPLLKNWRDDIRAGGISRDMALSKMALGTSVMATAAYWAGQGLITGSGPANIQSRKLLEQTGWQPYSINVDGKYYRYDKLDPFGGLLAMAADYSEIKEQLDDLNPNDADELALATIGITMDHLTPDFLVDSMGSFSEFLRDPQSGEGKRFLQNLVSGTMPFSSLARSITRYSDPTKRDISIDPTSPHPMFESILNNWKSQIPQYSKDLPAQLNIWGEPIVLGPGFGSDAFSPIYTTSKKSSPAMDEMIRLGMGGPILKPDPKPGEEHMVISMPPRFINKGGIPYRLNPQEYKHFVELSAGINLKGIRRTLKEELDDAVTSGFHKQLGHLANNDEARKIYIKKIISSYRSAAASQFLTEGVTERGVKKEFMEKVKERRKALGIR